MDPIFTLAAFVGVTSALFMVTRRNPVYSAVWLLIAFLSFAGIYLHLSAPFLAAIHVLVYTGAVLVLFLFVIMLLNLKDDELGEEYPASVRAVAAVGCFTLFALIAVPVWKASNPTFPALTDAAGFGSVENVGWLLFTKYGLPFELVSVLIVVAMFGAMVLAKKKLWT
jgi:NADH-quinone oxidoreductase subunit J